MCWFLMRFYVMLCMILMVCICYCCFDNFQMVNFVFTTIFYYNPKISFFMMNLEWNSMVMRFKNILILWYIIKCGSNNRLKIALTKHVPHLGYLYRLGYMNKYLVHNSIIANNRQKKKYWEIFGLLIKKIYKNSYVTKSTVSLYI